MGIRKLDPTATASIQDTKDESLNVASSISTEANLGVASMKDTFEATEVSILEPQLATVENEIKTLMNEIENKRSEENAAEEARKAGEEQETLHTQLKNSLLKMKLFP